MAEPTDRGAVGKEDSSLENRDFEDAFDIAAGVKESGTNGTSGATGDVLEESDELPLSTSGTQSDQSTSGTSAPASTSGTSGMLSADDQKAEQKYKTLQGIHRSDKDKWEIERKRLVEENERLKSTGTSGTSATPSGPVDPYKDLSAEDKEELKKYESEYDVVSKMEGLKRHAEMSNLRKEITNSLTKEFQSAFDYLVKTLAPAISTTEEISDERHFNMILKEHADFEKYRDDGSLESWIDGKPKYLKDAYTNVYNEGTAQDIIDLITTFKKENNIGSPASISGTAGTAGTAAIDKKKKKPDALMGFKGRQTPASLSQKDNSDYDGAFDEAANKT